MELLPKSSSFTYANTLILLLLSLALSAASAANDYSNETDRQALLAFRAGISEDPFRVLSSWNESVHFCQWHGVTCGHRHQQRVVRLELSSQNLKGTLSPYLGNLSFLRVLVMRNNSFTQRVPTEFVRLTRLQYLYLNTNSLVGEIPTNISACSNLGGFFISENKFTGRIPEELGLLSKLQYLYVAKNHLTGFIPSSLGNLSSLLYLWAADNNLVGIVPYTLGKLSKLQFFSLDGNQLSGTLPNPVFNITSITTFSISNNHFQGILPSDMGFTLPNLEFFAVFINNFTGLIPTSVSNMSNLYLLDMSMNRFVGQVPNLEKLNNLTKLLFSGNGLGNNSSNNNGETSNSLKFILSPSNNVSKLIVLGLNNNNFGGHLPMSISNLSSLTTLHLETNYFFGGIPDGLYNLFNLEDLDLGDNHFSGNIVPGIGNLHKLTYFDLSLNNFSGNIPWSIGNLSGIIQLFLYANNFQDNIPSSLGECQSLLLLDLSDNNLTGIIPKELLYLSSLSIALDLSRNQLTGPLPLEIGNLTNVQALNLSHNKLSGEIPSSLGACVRLEKLSMQGNFFQGTIPSSLSSLRGVELLDLSQNDLSGEIPKYFADIQFQYLNLSFNDFEGPLPSGGIFNNRSAAFVTGNPKLCADTPEMQLPGCNKSLESSDQNGSNGALKIVLCLVLGVLGISSVLIFLFVYYLHGNKAREVLNLDSLLGKSLTRVSYQSLLQATNGFSSENLIGTGSFGSVYRGILNPAGEVVAVKVFNLLRHAASKSFIIECKALQRIRHRNLVKVLSVCSSVDYQGNDFKAIIYEFMGNGSLEEWLHPDSSSGGIPAHHHVQTSRKNLKMLQRLNISIDIANTLDYLHNHQGQSPVVHCDLKPGNVLMDNELVGHLSDFGLSKFIPITTGQRFSESQSSSIGLRGTIGYTPPEYGIGSEVSVHGDTYSFGILLLEMFTGRRPTDGMFKDSYSLRNFVETALRNHVAAEIIDRRLVEEGGGGGAAKTQEIIEECCILAFKVGLASSAQSPGDRLSTANVLTQLRLITSVFLSWSLNIPSSI